MVCQITGYLAQSSPSPFDTILYQGYRREVLVLKRDKYCDLRLKTTLPLLCVRVRVRACVCVCVCVSYGCMM